MCPKRTLRHLFSVLPNRENRIFGQQSSSCSSGESTVVHVCVLPSRSFHHGVDFPHMSLVQHVESPLMRTQISRSRLNETQMWNISAQLDLRQLRPPETFCSQKATIFTRQYQSRHSQPSAPGRLGRKPQARFFFFHCLLLKISSCSRQRAKTRPRHRSRERGL